MVKTLCCFSISLTKKISKIGNKIGDHGAIGIAEALKFNQTLLHLFIYGKELFCCCCCTDVGVWEQKKKNKQDNLIGDKAMIAFSKSIRGNEKIQTLNFGCKGPHLLSC
jgi:hypothetical protein